MKKFLRSQFLPILIIFTLILFLTNNFGLIDIEKTAIVIAIGIDKNENEYEVTAQIAVPQATDASKDNSDAMVTGKGGTIADAIDDIGVTTGWYPLLSFCNLIAIGSNALKGDVMTFVDYFNRTDKIPDSSLLVACEGKAKDVLSVRTPLDSVPAFALEKILVKDIAKLNRISFTNVKDFTKGYFSKSESGYMPLIKEIKSNESNSVGEGNGGSGSGAPPIGSQGEDGGSETEKVFDCTSTLLFYKGVNVGIIDEEESLFFNMKRHRTKDTYFDLDDAEIDGKKFAMTLGLEEAEKHFSLKIENKPVFTVKLTLKCHVEDLDKSEDIGQLFTTETIPENVLRQAEDKIKGIYEKTFEKLKTSGCDLFGLKDELYKYHFFDYDTYKDDILQQVEIKAEIKCRTERNTRA